MLLEAGASVSLRSDRGVDARRIAEIFRTTPVVRPWLEGGAAALAAVRSGAVPWSACN